MSDFKDGLDSDLSNVFFNKDEFAEEITYNPFGGSPYTVNAIFDDEFESVDPESDASILSTQPAILIKTADIIGGPNPKDKVTIRGTTYQFITDEQNGVGVTRLQLHEDL